MLQTARISLFENGVAKKGEKVPVLLSSFLNIVFCASPGLLSKLFLDGSVVFYC